MKLCKAKTSKGKPCGANARRGKKYCFMHDPASGRARALARKRGGKHRRKGEQRSAFPDVDVKTVAGLEFLVEHVIKNAWSLETSVARSRTLGYLAGIQKSILEVGELESRVRQLEEYFAEQRGERGESRWPA
jgi:hypothetical protein